MDAKEKYKFVSLYLRPLLQKIDKKIIEVEYSATHDADHNWITETVHIVWKDWDEWVNVNHDSLLQLTKDVLRCIR